MTNRQNPSDKHLAVPMPERRQALKLLGSLGASVGLAPTASCDFKDGARGNTSPRPLAPVALSDSDFALISRLTELIIPRTDTPGALEAGVPEFIRAALSGIEPPAMSGRPDVPLDNLPVLFVDGLRWIDAQAKTRYARGFLELPDKQQQELLQSCYITVEAGIAPGRSVQFLRTLKNMTVEGYYTSEQGLLHELGYLGNTPHAAPQQGCRPG
jgi:gluconate 2-dehydrogenase gamma chain